MRAYINSSGNIYIYKDFYNNGKRKTSIFEKLGRLDDLCKEKNMTPEEVKNWAKQYAKDLTLNEKNENQDTILSFSTTNLIEPDIERLRNCGYLFLKSIYHELKLDSICNKFKSKHRYEFNLSKVLEDLIYSRVLNPSSKRSSYAYAKKLIDQPKYGLEEIYRALSVLAKHTDEIQSELYKNSNFIKQRNTKVLYYDCTNYYFEIEDEEDDKRYGKSKEHRPNPIIGMGLMMDADGMPLAFDIYPGNRNEQITLKPLEERVIKDFEVSKFIYCSDAGLGSKKNKQLNAIQDRAYIITKSLKALKKNDREVALNGNNFKEVGNPFSNPKQLKDIDFSLEENKNKLFYKEMPLDEKLNERLIITYSAKYAAYQRRIREEQIKRANNMISKKGKLKKNRKNPNDPARFVEKVTVDKNGEKVEESYYLNYEKINEEAQYDGYYALTTNLQDDNIEEILIISERRWQIEECFRIMKTEFKARPVYLQREDRIKAHFLICFISLLIYRLLSYKLKHEFTAHELLQTLREMNLVDTEKDYYLPAYKRTKMTDQLHETFGFRTDYEAISHSKMKKIIKNIKERKVTTKL